MIRVDNTGNCNVQYFSGLYGYGPLKMREALLDLLTSRVNAYNYWNDKPAAAVPPTFRNPTCGIYLFAQGSEHPVKTTPYAHNMKALIDSLELGPVVESPPAQNPSHNNKKGYLFVWVINRKRAKAWWESEQERIKNKLPDPSPVVADVTNVLKVKRAPRKKKVTAEVIKNDVKE